MIVVGTSSLTESQSDKRDYFVGNVLKNIDKIIPPSELMRGITETYYQSNFPSCTAMATIHSIKSQNELEYKTKVDITRKDLRQAMGHSISKPDNGDSVENAVKTALKTGINATINSKGVLLRFECRAFGKWLDMTKAITISPLITVVYGNTKTWNEMISGEIKTVAKIVRPKGHAVLICGYDDKWVYFYNSFGDRIKKGGISNFKVSWANYEKMIATGMLNYRFFMLLDKSDLVDMAKQKEISNQIINACKKLYDIGDAEMKAKFEDWQISKFLTKKYGL